jgi:hypothetical protein
MNKSSESYKVYLEKSEAAPGGSGENQKEVGGQSYPGRALPAVQEVKQAQDNPGTAVRCAKEQTGLNRYPINSHEEKEHHHGPNN